LFFIYGNTLFSTVSLFQKAFNVLIPFLFASLAIFSAGSTPNAFIVEKFFKKVPSLEPMSIIRSFEFKELF
jgi:hypothetical protein